MSDIARIEGIRYERKLKSVTWIVSKFGTTAGGSPLDAWFTAPMTNPTSCLVLPSVWDWLGSV
jgi:hypothetical protein